VKVNSHPTFSIPRSFTFFSIPIIFIHPNGEWPAEMVVGIVAFSPGARIQAD